MRKRSTIINPDEDYFYDTCTYEWKKGVVFVFIIFGIIILLSK